MEKQEKNVEKIKPIGKANRETETPKKKKFNFNSSDYLWAGGTLLILLFFANQYGLFDFLSDNQDKNKIVSKKFKVNEAKSDSNKTLKLLKENEKEKKNKFISKEEYIKEKKAILKFEQKNESNSSNNFGLTKDDENEVKNKTVAIIQEQEINNKSTKYIDKERYDELLKKIERLENKITEYADNNLKIIDENSKIKERLDELQNKINKKVKITKDRHNIQDKAISNSNSLFCKRKYKFARIYKRVSNDQFLKDEEVFWGKDKIAVSSFVKGEVMGEIKQFFQANETTWFNKEEFVCQ